MAKYQISLSELLIKQNNKCCYCGCEMKHGGRDPSSASVEHVKDAWASPKNQKIETVDNLKAACYSCNNSRGIVRNLAARRYYQQLINKKGVAMKAASTKSTMLYKMFGPVPEEVFCGIGVNG